MSPPVHVGAALSGVAADELLRREVDGEVEEAEERLLSTDLRKKNP